MKFLDKDYIDQEILTYGRINEREDMEIVCPYCGAIYEATDEIIENGEFEYKEMECEECGKEFLYSYWIHTRNYFTSTRME